MRLNLARGYLSTAALLCVALALAASHNLGAQGAGSQSTVTGTDVIHMVSGGKFEEARKAGLARIAAANDDIDAYVGLSLSLLALNRFADAQAWASRGYSLARDPRLAQAAGEAAFHRGQNDIALDKLREYLGAFPEGNRAGLSYYMCGEIYIRQARFQHADIAFSTALQYSPGNPLWWARLGWARENSGRLIQAMIAYDKALSLAPQQADALAGKKRLADRMRQ